MGSPVRASQIRRPVPAPGKDGLAVGVERHGHDAVPVSERLPDGSSGVGVPDPRRPVPAPGEDGLAVGAHRDGGDVAPVGEDPFQAGAVSPPVGEAGQGGMPPGRVCRVGGGAGSRSSRPIRDRPAPARRRLARARNRASPTGGWIGRGPAGVSPPPRSARRRAGSAGWHRAFGLPPASTAGWHRAASAGPGPRWPPRPARSRTRSPGCAGTTGITAPPSTPAARIGRSSANRCKSSANAAAVAYRAAGSRAIALATIVSRSRGTPGANSLSRSGSS